VAERIRLAWPDVGEEEARAVAAVLEDGMLTMGPRVVEFERRLAAACETSHAVSVSSGTAALHLALLALEIGPGDEVLVPAYTFPATANVVVLAGATPRLVDVDPHTMNIDIARLADAITPGTRAVIAVHLFGRPLDWDALRAAVPERVLLVEDAAGALGARYRGRRCGSLGDLGCLSFHPRKIVTTGDGGAVTTDDDALADALRSLRNHGVVPGGGFEIERPGLNYRLPDIL
jgi:perosamine synthetase